MRIIAGTHRSRPFQAPPDDKTTRPITDRAKETLFNRLLSLGMFGTEDEQGRPTPFHAADVFSGTGSMGLECLSRGAEGCLFVEADRSIRGLLEENLRHLRLAERARVHAGSALAPAWVALLPANTRLVFLDPPYPLTTDAAERQRLLDLLPAVLARLEPGGLVVWRGPLESKERVDWPAVAGADGPTTFEVGTMEFVLWQKPLPAEA